MANNSKNKKFNKILHLARKRKGQEDLQKSQK